MRVVGVQGPNNKGADIPAKAVDYMMADNF